MRALQQFDDLFSTSFALGFVLSHSKWNGHPARQRAARSIFGSQTTSRVQPTRYREWFRTALSVFSLPVNINASIFQSPINDHSGCVKVAGRFFSMKKCADQ